MTLRHQITVLHKKKKLSQRDLDKQIETSSDIIGRHVILLADALKISLDYLVGKTGIELHNPTLSRIQEIAKLPEKRNHRYLRLPYT